MIDTIDTKELKGLNKATEQIHTAVQFLAMTGEFFSPQKKDGSHSNLGWLTMKEKFITRPFGNHEKFVLELSPSEMTLTLYNKQAKIESNFPLKGKTEKEALEWLVSQFNLQKISKAKSYKIAPPYPLPDYTNLEGKKFKRSPKKAFAVFSKLRSLAELEIRRQIVPFENTDEIRTWPHHLDHAAIIPLDPKKGAKSSKSISIGLAIHDSVVNEHYFYVRGWENGNSPNLSKMKPLEFGEWIENDLKGAILRVSSLANEPNIHHQINTFFTESMGQLLKALKYKSKSANVGEK